MSDNLSQITLIKLGKMLITTSDFQFINFTLSWNLYQLLVLALKLGL